MKNNILWKYTWEYKNEYIIVNENEIKEDIKNYFLLNKHYIDFFIKNKDMIETQRFIDKFNLGNSIFFMSANYTQLISDMKICLKTDKIPYRKFDITATSIIYNMKQTFKKIYTKRNIDYYKDDNIFKTKEYIDILRIRKINKLI